MTRAQAIESHLRYIQLVFQECVSAFEARQRGGMQVPFFGDFGNITNPSTIVKMRWYIREWDTVLERKDK
jgi:hypothetical protein